MEQQTFELLLLTMTALAGVVFVALYYVRAGYGMFQTSKWGISKARFYVSASNLFIITGYSGYDPEVDIQTGLTCGMDYNRYPRSRSFVLGTNITF